MPELVGQQSRTILAPAPALMKLIAVFPLEHFDIPAFDMRMPPQASQGRQSYCD